MKHFPVGLAMPEGVMFYIGNFVVSWGRLESITNAAVRALAFQDNDAARCVTNQMELRQKIKSLKALVAIAYRETAKPQRSTLDDIEKWLTYILDTMIPIRNRIIHDEWGNAPNGLADAVRGRSKAVAIKPQSRQRDVEFWEETTLTVEELRDYCARIEDANWAIGMLILLKHQGILPEGFSVRPVPIK